MAAALSSALLQLIIFFCSALYSQAYTYTSHDVYHMDSGNCGTLYTKYGTLYSHSQRDEGSKRRPFSGMTWCRLQIRVEYGRQIVIFAEDNFIDLDGQGQIRFYDGVNNYPHWIWATSGSDPMPALVTSSNLMTIEYYTNWNAGGGATGFTLYYSSFTHAPCSMYEYSCLFDQRCIDSSQVCDGHIGCHDQSDETNNCNYSLINGMSAGGAIAFIFFIVVMFGACIICILCFTLKHKKRQDLVHVVRLPPPPPPGHMIHVYPNQQPPQQMGGPVPPPQMGRPMRPQQMGGPVPPPQMGRPMPLQQMGRPMPPPQMGGHVPPSQMARPVPPAYPVGDPAGMEMPPPPPILY